MIGTYLADDWRRKITKRRRKARQVKRKLNEEREEGTRCKIGGGERKETKRCVEEEIAVILHKTLLIQTLKCNKARKKVAVKKETKLALLCVPVMDYQHKTREQNEFDEESYKNEEVELEARCGEKKEHWSRSN